MYSLVYRSCLISARQLHEVYSLDRAQGIVRSVIAERDLKCPRTKIA